MTTYKWVLDPTHSELGFKIKHLMISNISGSFQQFQVEVETENDDFRTAQIRAAAEIASIHTNNEQRDHHLRNSDFFEAETYPRLSFQSTKVEQQDEDNFTVYGDLTMKGVRKPVQLKVEYSGVTKDPWGGVRAGFTITGKLNRSDWGINFNGVLETGGLALSEEVKINSEIQLVKQLEPVLA
ncbi:YceI family protein [Spirosoma sp. BT702]|uniref:YceI family protein n=1 Tax=Spirosoma profusum TaxID=2771354 RepID=A0A926XSK4_9BACT|nr:YceI family protein [Spirosoma profusum]MBD2699139.1 YceI family protein [Spirosoma profusum]